MVTRPAPERNKNTNRDMALIKDLTRKENWDALASIAIFGHKDYAASAVDNLFEQRKFVELNKVMIERAIDIQVGGTFIPVSDSEEVVFHTLNKFEQTGNMHLISGDTVATFMRVTVLDNYLSKLKTGRL
jgi:hypothetical protein